MIKSNEEQKVPLFGTNLHGNCLLLSGNILIYIFYVCAYMQK